MSLFKETADIHAPLRKYTIKTKPTPWLTDYLRDLMEMRGMAKLEAKTSGYPSDWAVYRKLRNYVVKINREHKRSYFQNAINDSKNDTKSMWNTINNLIERSHHVSPIAVGSNGRALSKPIDIANHFAKFFDEKIKNFRNEMSDSIDMEYTTGLINTIMADKNCHFEFKPLSILEVQSCLENLPDSKVTGVDNIDNFLLKTAAEIIAEPVTHIINRSYDSSIFPDQWKNVKLHPIPKDKKKAFENINSRPISLLNVLSKLQEKFAYQQMSHYLSEHKILVINQHAYRDNHSTETALIHLTDQCLENMEQVLLTGAVMLDFSAAFDLVDRNLLLAKLKCYNFSDRAVGWICSYLSGRTSAVYINGSYSNLIEMECGVPQGSCLGPLLFKLVYK